MHMRDVLYAACTLRVRAPPAHTLPLFAIAAMLLQRHMPWLYARFLLPLR